jgi:asparagine synthase (glutamine-hydrolysing)
MCGFAGVVTWDDRYRVSPETLGRMSAAIAHRGPDGEGSYINHQQEVTPDRPQVALAFRRLAILDPDPRSNQPFTDGRHWLVFNGEIYNFRELRKELTSLRPDYEWRTTGDTEVLLAAYAVWGEKCVEHLNGMFAFVVWDEVEKSLFLVRDRMGQKPLYVGLIDANGDWTRSASSGQTLELPPPPVVAVFASDLRALVAAGLKEPSVDISNLTRYLHFGYQTGAATIYEGISQQLPSSSVSITARRYVENWYWPENDWSDPNEIRTREDAAAVSQTRLLMRQAVRRQLVADVPLGCFLSGGMDSSIVAAAMKSAALEGQQVHTFSIGFDDPRYDETEFAERVSEHLGTRHQSFKVRPDAAQELPALAAAFGEPFGDSSALPTHYLSRETRKQVKVAISGDGGDELFGGYDRYRAMALSERLRRMTTAIPWHLAASVSHLIPGSHPKSASVRTKRFLQSVRLSKSWRYSAYHRLFSGDQIVELLGHWAGSARSYGPTHGDHFECIFGLPWWGWSGRVNIDGIQDVVRAALAVDRLLYLPNDLLTKVDRCSMLHGLEVRSPFMDHELVQFAAGLTTDQLLKGGPKRMLREAFADDLPAWVFKRKKMGFAVPIGEWFRGELRPMLRDTLFAADSFGRQHFNMNVVQRLVEEHEQEKIDHSQRLYALLMLELWWNTVKK